MVSLARPRSLGLADVDVRLLRRLRRLRLRRLRCRLGACARRDGLRSLLLGHLRPTRRSAHRLGRAARLLLGGRSPGGGV